jgi:hypothetical protein
MKTRIFWIGVLLVSVKGHDVYENAERANII